MLELVGVLVRAPFRSSLVERSDGVDEMVDRRSQTHAGRDQAKDHRKGTVHLVVTQPGELYLEKILQRLEVRITKFTD